MLEDSKVNLQLVEEGGPGPDLDAPTTCESGEGLPRKGPGRPSKIVIYRCAVNMMMGAVNMMVGGGSGPWPQFHRKFHIMKDPRGEHILLEELDDQIVRYISLQALEDAIYQYMHVVCAMVPHTKIDGSGVKEIRKLWAATANVLKEAPPSFREKSDPGLTFHRLTFDFVPDENFEHAPLFKEMLERCSDPLALSMWIGSLFEVKSDRQQYLWLYGEGGNGKGALARALSTAMGASACWEQPPEKESTRFWTLGLLGKRLVVFGDCNQYGFPTTGLFKTLTGGDPIRVEVKKGPAYTAELSAKFLFLSNARPSLSSEKSDMRRAIYVEIDKIAGEMDPGYQERLNAELPWIIGGCLVRYFRGCPSDGQIQVDNTILSAFVDEDEAHIMHTLGKYFHFHQPRPVSKESDIPWVGAATFQGVLKDAKMDFHERRRFSSFLERKGFKKKVKASGTVELRYIWMTKIVHILG